MIERLALRILTALTPTAERAEVLADLAAEAEGRSRVWLWGQVLRSIPALLVRGWWRGWHGFEADANRMRPGGAPMESWIVDFRFAARRLRTRPTYAILAIVTLALGVGGAAAISSIVRGLFAPLPIANERQVAIFWDQFDWSEAEYLYLRPVVHGFSGIAAWRFSPATLESDGAPTRLLHGIASTAGLFDLLGAHAALGRTFREGEDRPGASNVVVLSHQLWKELGADSAIIGKPLRLAGAGVTVVGVMPESFWFPYPGIQLWTPAPLDPTVQAGMYAFMGRMPPGKGTADMTGPLSQITQLLGARFQYPAQWDKTKHAKLIPVREYLLGDLKPALRASVLAIALILLIGCANVAALMLGQLDARTGELAVRTALGADRRRLAQQLVAEALLVGMLAGAAGAALAAAGFRFLVSRLPLGFMAANARVDWSLFAIAMLVAVIASLAVSVIPMLALWRGDVRGALTRLRTTAGGGRSSRLEAALVGGEVALAVLMAAGAGLLIRSVTHLYAIDPGLDARQVAVIDLTMPNRMPMEQRRQALSAIVGAAGGIPGVQSASAIEQLPLRGRVDSWGMHLEGEVDVQHWPTTYLRFVEPRYFETMRYRLVSGRLFDSTDRALTERAVVINQSLAKLYFPGASPLGRRITTFPGFERIIGVVADAAEGNLADSASPARYMLVDQVPFTPESWSLVLRLARPELAPLVLAAARGSVRAAAPTIAIREATTMGEVFDIAIGPARQVMALLMVLTGLALVLGAVGVYGVITQFVERRRRDWGIRIALGMAPARLLGLVVRRGVTLVGAGALIGLVAALAGARVLGSLLYGVRASDPLALGAAAVLLLVIGALAALAPAWRASRVDPASVLREQ